MKIRTSTAMILAAGACGLFLTAPFGFAQGSLTPPGAPAPTMKTLSQVEPRTPISSLPYTISIPGSYYVTTNLTSVSGSDGIDIGASDVTLDLNGFTLLGVAGANAGINVTNTQGNLVIRNGVLDSWGTNGVNAGNGYNVQFERLLVSNCDTSSNGAFGAGGLFAGSNCVVLACIVSGNKNDGIFVGNNCTVKDCIASGNRFGIFVGNNCAVIDCTASDNNTDGINSGNNCTVNTCTAGGNGDDGISVENNCTVKDCTASANGDDGIEVFSNCTVKDCTAGGNKSDGIYVSENNCLIAGNTCIANSQYGIEIFGSLNRIDGNNAGNNTSYGIIADSLNVDNCITRNFSPGPGYGGYSGNNDYAPSGKVNTSTNPWQNFQ